MNFIVHPLTMGGLFKRGFQIYKTHFIPLVILNGILLVIPWTLPWIAEIFNQVFAENPFSNFIKSAEVVILFLEERLLEAAMLLALATLLFRPFIPVVGILRYFRSRVFFGVVHIGLLQYFILVFGMMGLLLPFPFNVIIVSLWISSACFFVLAQPIYLHENLRGMQALVRSAQIIRPYFAKAFLVIMGLKALGTLIPGVFALVLLSDLDLPTATTSEAMITQLMELFKNPHVQSVMRGAQYSTNLFIQPFAAIVICLFYLNCLQLQAGLDFTKLSQLVANALGILPDPAIAIETPPVEAVQETHETLLPFSIEQHPLSNPDEKNAHQEVKQPPQPFNETPDQAKVETASDASADATKTDIAKPEDSSL